MSFREYDDNPICFELQRTNYQLIAVLLKWKEWQWSWVCQRTKSIDSNCSSTTHNAAFHITKGVTTLICTVQQCGKWRKTVNAKTITYKIEMFKLDMPMLLSLRIFVCLFSLELILFTVFHYKIILTISRALIHRQIKKKKKKEMERTAAAKPKQTANHSKIEKSTQREYSFESNEMNWFYFVSLFR